MRRWAELLALVLCGAVLRADGLLRPIDQPSWRECDLAAVARAYDREGLGTFFYPQVDWGGRAPRFAEMELPLPSWFMALGQRATGQTELSGRVLAYASSIAALVAMTLLAANLLGRSGALAATLFFAAAPLALRLSTAIQPDGPMLAASVWSAYFWVRWLQSDRTWELAAAAAAASLAVLFKAPAAQLSVLFLLSLLAERGRAGLLDGRLWAIALLALVPPALWYYHAHQLWLDYGNSLGMSNESHWIGLDFFRRSHLALGLGEIELFTVWTPTLVPVAVLALVGRSHPLARRLSVCWLVASALFLLAAVRTTSDSFFDYYHVLAVPAVALLFGLGCEELIARLARNKPTWSARCVTAGLTLAAALALRLRSLAVGAAAAPLVVEFLRWAFPTEPAEEPAANGSPSFAAGALLTFLTICAVATPLGEMARWRETRVVAPSQKYLDAQRMRSLVTAPGELVASGSSQVDHEGKPVAYQASYFFYWLDRHGFSLPLERHRVAELKSLSDNGARYFVLEKSRDTAELEKELQSQFTLRYDGETAQLYEL